MGNKCEENLERYKDGEGISYVVHSWSGCCSPLWYCGRTHYYSLSFNSLTSSLHLLTLQPSSSSSSSSLSIITFFHPFHSFSSSSSPFSSLFFFFLFSSPKCIVQVCNEFHYIGMENKVRVWLDKHVVLSDSL